MQMESDKRLDDPNAAVSEPRTEEQTPPDVAPPARTQRNAIAEWAVTILVMLFASTTVAWSYVIPTGSMEDTLLIGDHIIVDKLAYAEPGTISRFLLPYQNPKRGDVFAFRYPVDVSQTFVKRVIGIPGDRIKIVDNRLYRNGVLLDEPYVFHKSPFVSSYQANFPPPYVSNGIGPDSRRELFLRDMLQHHVVNGEVVVPPDSYFAMGDNRDNSLDSRYWGFVPRQNIIGKPALVFWSYDAPTDELMPSSPKDFGRHLIDVGEHFFTRTRWSRTLRPVRGFTAQQ